MPRNFGHDMSREDANAGRHHAHPYMSRGRPPAGRRRWPSFRQALRRLFDWLHQPAPREIFIKSGRVWVNGLEVKDPIRVERAIALAKKLSDDLDDVFSAMDEAERRMRKAADDFAGGWRW